MSIGLPGPPGSDAVHRELAAIRRWLALGAIGVALLGASALVVAAAFAAMMTVMEKGIAESFEEPDGGEDGFVDSARKLFEQGKHQVLAEVLARRAESHPHDAHVSWYRARLAAARGDWDEALGLLRETALLAPSWTDSHIRPFEAELRARRDGGA